MSPVSPSRGEDSLAKVSSLGWLERLVGAGAWDGRRLEKGAQGRGPRANFIMESDGRDRVNMTTRQRTAAKKVVQDTIMEDVQEGPRMSPEVTESDQDRAYGKPRDETLVDKAMTAKKKFQYQIPTLATPEIDDTLSKLLGTMVSVSFQTMLQASPRLLKGLRHLLTRQRVEEEEEPGHREEEKQEEAPQEVANFQRVPDDLEDLEKAFADIQLSLPDREGGEVMRAPPGTKDNSSRMEFNNKNDINQANIACEDPWRQPDRPRDRQRPVLVIGPQPRASLGRRKRKLPACKPSPTKEGEVLPAWSEEEDEQRMEGKGEETKQTNHDEGRQGGEDSDPDDGVQEVIVLSSEDETDEISRPREERQSPAKSPDKEATDWEEEFGPTPSHWFEQWASVVKHEWMIKAQKLMAVGRTPTPLDFFTEKDLQLAKEKRDEIQTYGLGMEPPCGDSREKGVKRQPSQRHVASYESEPSKRLLFPLGFWHAMTCRVDTWGGTSTNPYTKEEEEKIAAILKERKEKKEAKKKALKEEQAAKLKKIEEEMAREKERLKKEEEEKLKEVDEEEEGPPLQRKSGQNSGNSGDAMEKKISEWVANLSLGEEEEVMMYIPKDDQEAAMKAWDAEKDPLRRQALEDQQRMEWKLAMMREKKRMVNAASEAVKELEEVQKLTLRLTPQVDLQQKVEIIAQSVERLARVQKQQYEFSRSQDIAVRSMRLGFRDFARELVGAVGAEVSHRLEKTERFCVGAIEGIKAAAPKEEEARPRREPIKVNFPDSYSGKREENFDNWDANVKTYVHLQQVFPDQQILIAIHALRDEAANFARQVSEPTEEKPTDPAISKLLEEFKDLTEPPTGTVPRPIQHRIEIEPGSRTPKGAMYRMSLRELEELRKQLNELLEKGWIRPSSSPFGAPVLFVPKKEGELRMCIDYRGLNVITVKNAELLPRIDDLLDRVQGAKYFSKIDLKSRYQKIEVHPDDQYKTAFRTRYGHYEFIVMPFGPTNAPTTFQRCMNDLFRPWLDRFVVVYLDGSLVFSRTLEEHQGHLRQVLEKLREANFKINAKKCD
ncbi:hypothetical protein CBR_g64855 [Chara braunii]|uniref:Reverse transcriptase domain-containing protein n=1 Tax=Chara braunii TaxID=69332 RepID=A0A388K9H3_CHABU|nr:hypothetical protein CBR_g64855 [Chara braunii]|eukprot:GBG66583.1 hypothetical protein CBR_g64855 [Chara braunii]